MHSVPVMPASVVREPQATCEEEEEETVGPPPPPGREH